MRKLSAAALACCLALSSCGADKTLAAKNGSHPTKLRKELFEAAARVAAVEWNAEGAYDIHAVLTTERSARELLEVTTESHQLVPESSGEGARVYLIAMKGRFSAASCRVLPSCPTSPVLTLRVSASTERVLESRSSKKYPALKALGVPFQLESRVGTIQAGLTEDGSGRMVANVSEGHNGEQWSWQACNEDGLHCSSFGTGQSIETRGARPGTVFRAREALAGATAMSPVWHGDVEPVLPPHVSGQIRGNALVTPVRGTWKGGWAGDFDRTQLAACVYSDGTDCTTLTNHEYSRKCPDEAAVIDPVFTGRYLRVADKAYGPSSRSGEIGPDSPYGAPLWPAGPTTSVAIVGQIAPATGARESSCGPPPLASVLPRPRF